jgi:hypothetical protein
MKSLSALLLGAAYMLALTNSASAAPRNYAFSIPINVNLSGVTVFGGAQITGWGVDCTVSDASNNQLAWKFQSFTVPQLNQTVAINAEAQPYWKANPNATAVSWVCVLEVSTDKYSTTFMTRTLSGVNASSTIMIRKGSIP